MQTLTIHGRKLFLFVSEAVAANMYVTVGGQAALIVDPQPDAEALDFLQGLDIQECTVLLTHEHPDHTWGIPALQNRFHTRLICQRSCAAAIADENNNHPAMVAAMLAIQDNRNGTRNADLFLSRYPRGRVYTADETFDGEHVLHWQDERFLFRHTPGHTAGSCCIVWNDEAVFTGDSLLRDIPVLTRIPGGNTKQYQRETLPFLHSLDRDILVLPGHGPVFHPVELPEKK